MIKFILPILLLLIGCSDDLPLGPSINSTYNFELSLGLEQDLNGYYHVPMVQESEYSDQVFYQLKVETNTLK